MISAAAFDELSAPIVDLYELYAASVIADIARRLARIGMSSASAYQMQRLIESGQVYQNALRELSKISGISQKTLEATFSAAGVRSLAFDDKIYKLAGLNPIPLPLSQPMLSVLLAGLQKTGGLISNLTMTTAQSSRDLFVNAADLAYVSVTSGAMSYDQAIRAAVKNVAAEGISTIDYANGRREHLDVAMRRTVLTGVAQTTAELSLARMDEMGSDLLQMSAHAGARNKGTGPMNHESWQGRIFSKSGTSTKYPPFVESTGYGTVTGYAGANCRHSAYVWFEGLSEAAYTQQTLDEYADRVVTYNGIEMSQYEASQRQRAIERHIRHWKRQAAALSAAGLDNTAEMAKVRFWQAQMRSFLDQVKLSRQPAKEGGRVLINRV